MATQAWSTRVRHDSDAMFREYGLEFNTKLAAAGLVQTADTGQIDWTTVVRSGINTLTAGYEIWRFNDAQQSTSPIFFKIDYGTGSATGSPRWAITVGTGSDGSGTLTGTAKTAQRNVVSASGTFNSDTARQSYLCVTEGFVGFQWKIGSGSAAGSFWIARTNTSSGVPDNLGCVVNWGPPGSVSAGAVRQALRLASPAAAYTAVGSTVDEASAALGFMAQAPASSAIGADTQIALAWGSTPDAAPLISVCGVYPADEADNSTFSATLFGSTSHTYMVMTGNGGPFGPIATGSTGAMRTAMLYE